MMEKRNYCSPRLAVEHFIPNEYVAVCYALSCTQGKHDDPVSEGWNYGNSDHKCNGGDGGTKGQAYMAHGGSCVNATYVYDGSSGIYVRECNEDQGWMNCEIISPESWGNVIAGTTVEWYTYNTDNHYRWHHKGVAQQITGRNKNAS